MMSFSLLAQVLSAPATQPVTNEPGIVSMFKNLGPILPMGIILLVFMMFMSRNKKKQEKVQQDLRDNVKRGDTVETIGGLIGTVVSNNEEEKTITIKVDETANVKMKFNRRAIHRVITDEKAK